MANLHVKDGVNADKYLKETGAGTNLDPHIPEVYSPAIGTLNDAAVTTDAQGSVLSFLRGLVKLIAAGIGVTVSNPTTNPETGLAKNTDLQAIQANAGSDATKVVSVQGVTSGKAVPVSADGTVVTGETLETGGVGFLGWLTSIRMAIKTGLQGILGQTNGAAVVTDADGTIQQYLRGLVKLIAAKINVKIVDGDDATLGITTGAAITTDVDGTVQRYIRGLVKLWISGIYSGTGLVSQANPLPVSQTRVVAAAADVNAPAVNTAAIVTYVADATKKHVITGVAWSYIGGIPVGGNLKIEDVAGTVVFSVDIDKPGPGSFEFPRPKIGAAANTAMIITLAAGGAGVTGKISIENHWLE